MYRGALFAGRLYAGRLFGAVDVVAPPPVRVRGGVAHYQFPPLHLLPSDEEEVAAQVVVIASWVFWSE
jgi:hypothetical protein